MYLWYIHIAFLALTRISSESQSLGQHVFVIAKMISLVIGRSLRNLLKQKSDNNQIIKLQGQARYPTLQYNNLINGKTFQRNIENMTLSTIMEDFKNLDEL